MGTVTSEFALWAAASATRAGQSVSGDRSVVVPYPGGLLLANVDGVGHGEEAARAAEKAVSILQTFADLPLEEIFRRCHEALRDTRGAALIAASFDATGGTLSWAAVGDLNGVMYRADASVRPRREMLLPREGVIGHSLPPTSPRLLSVHEGDVLVLATDGVRADFAEALNPGSEPLPRLAQRILKGHGKGTDDAQVLVARFRRAGA
jgi:serine phosphatase RsbU (regulator of sigma subunit)